jgi:hypothetical protein
MHIARMVTVRPPQVVNVVVSLGNMKKAGDQLAARSRASAA